MEVWCGVQVKDKVAVHVPCSSKKMGIEAAFMNLASRCARDVQPSAVPCCGMAGDRGMRCAPSPPSGCARTTTWTRLLEYCAQVGAFLCTQ